MEAIIIDRVAQILGKRTKIMEQFYKEQDVLLKTLDEPTKEKFETFACSIMVLNSEECKVVYKEAFLDGLQLGHRAF